MEEVKSKNWYMLLLKGLVMVFLSALIFMDPFGALLAYTIYIGIGAIIAGVVILVKSFKVKRGKPGWGWGILEGMMDLFFGFVLLSHPSLTIEILPFVFGFWGVFYGIMLIVSAFSGEGSMMLKLLSGIFVFIMANIMMFNPLFAGMTIAIWVAILFLIVGIYNIFISLIIKA